MSRTSLVFTRISPRLHFFSFLSVISNSHYIFAILSSFCVQKDSRLCFCHFLFFLISSDFAYLYFFHCILIFHVHFLIYFSAFIFCLLFVNLVLLFFSFSRTYEYLCFSLVINVYFCFFFFFMFFRIHYDISSICISCFRLIYRFLFMYQVPAFILLPLPFPVLLRFVNFPSIPLLTISISSYFNSVS